jgi:two-component system chemotaxis sensor kinase CheA
MEATHTNTTTSVRIQVSLLDSLVNLAGELVLGRNQLMQAIGGGNQRALETTSQRIDLVTSELQEQIMRARMQPIGVLFDTLPRIVRDLARQSKKQVELSVTGKMVEIDKSIMESIEEPVKWLVQQSVKHGIELPDVRNKLLKPEQGLIEIKAYHEAGQVIVDINDDGKGVDPDIILSAAVEKGLLSKGQETGVYSASEKIGLVFLLGLSSGHDPSGNLNQFAGIDEVKSGIEKLGGTLELNSNPGQGTSVRMKLPLTLSIIPSQIIKLGRERFAIPQVNLNELLRIPARQVKNVIETVCGANVIRLRGELLPLVDLSTVLGLDRSYTDQVDGQQHPERRHSIADRRSVDHSSQLDDYDGPERRGDHDRRHHAESALNVAVVSAGKHKYGLIVDDMNDTEEIVVKPLGKHLVDCSGFSGATIMGDGKVALILDVASIGGTCGLSKINQKELNEMPQAECARGTEAETSQSYLFFSSSETERFAVPLNLVERIEKIDANRIETIGGKRVLKNRGGTLPLLALDDSIVIDPLPDKDHYQVICFTINGKEIGVLATPPIDAADVSIRLDENTLSQPGVTGSAVIMDQTTLILDIEQVVRNVKPDLFEGECADG